MALTVSAAPTSCVTQEILILGPKGLMGVVGHVLGNTL
jgi:hypothetical protein